MANIAKVIRVIGQSEESFAEAARVAVKEAAETVRGIHGAHVIEMSAVVENDPSRRTRARATRRPVPVKTRSTVRPT